MRLPSFVILGCALGLATVGAGSAAAQTLSWSAPAGCPDAAFVQQRVTPADAAIDVRALVTRGVRDYVLSLELRTNAQTVQRELRAKDCRVLAETAGTLISMAASTAPKAVDVMAPEAPPQDDMVAAGADAARSDAPARPIPAGTPPVARWRLVPWWSLAAGLMGNGIPGPRPDLLGALGLDVGPISLSVRAGHMFADSSQVAPGTTERFVTNFLSLQTCGRFAFARFAAGPCASLQGDRIHVTTRGLTMARPANTLWAQLGVGAMLRMRIVPRFEIGLESGLLLPLSERPRFRIEPLGTLERGRIVAGYLHFEAAVRFE